MLFSQKEMNNARIRSKISKEQILKEKLGLDDVGLENILTSWEQEREVRRENSRMQRKIEKSRQLDLFPEQKEFSLWQKSISELSASKLATYRGCPLAFNYNYLLHVKVPQSPSKIFGKEIHYMLESFHKMNFKSADSFVGFWKHRWWGVVNGDYGDIEIAFKNKGQSGSLCWWGERILRHFYEHNKKLPKPLMVEEDFGKYNLEFEGIKLKGKWDRVDEIDGKIVITDYKTDFFSPAQDTFLLHRLPQFTFYALAWHKKFGKIPHLGMHHLRSGQVFRTKRTEDDFEYLGDVIVKTKKRILEGDFTPFYGFHCKLCDFKPFCRGNCVGVSSRLKKREEKEDTKPELWSMLSYDIPEKESRKFEIKKYEEAGNFKKAYYSLIEDLKNVQCPLETREGALACLLWEEDSPIKLPDPELDN